MGWPGSAWDGPRYQLRQMPGMRDRGALALPHNGLGNPPGPTFFAQGMKDGLELVEGSVIHQRLSRMRLGGVHAHIEGAIKAKAEATRRGV